MTRTGIINQSLAILGDSTLATSAIDWFANCLYEIEAAGFLTFLEKQTTYQTENGVQSVAFSASKWPAAALTDYSKGMYIYSSEGRKLEEISKEAYDVRNIGETGYPKYFTIFADVLYLYPKPVTSYLPLLTVHYYKQISLPAQGTDELSTIGIKTKYQSSLIWGVLKFAGMYNSDDRASAFQQNWDAALGKLVSENQTEKKSK